MYTFKRYVEGLQESIKITGQRASALRRNGRADLVNNHRHKLQNCIYSKQCVCNAYVFVESGCQSFLTATPSIE